MKHIYVPPQLLTGIASLFTMRNESYQIKTCNQQTNIPSVRVERGRECIKREELMHVTYCELLQGALRLGT
jgi:hypothetical protein